ncbi:uncharacterized protein LOC132705455 [Cylas formicarius]|uniref:uncharacterized protein LOC132705455 n=1 Tax=Cylas formicarius TaxID=197179 RepID=UPI002958D5C2|nr:uncharacterized protein LOC132705455 [Cylas formicarius]
MNTKKAAADRLKFGPYLTTYNKDFVKFKSTGNTSNKYLAKQEFKDPVCEGFKNCLHLNDADDFLEKMTSANAKVARLYFDESLDHIIIKGDRLLNGKSLYQVDYCDIEADVKRKLLQTDKEKIALPEGWEIPLTTQKYDYRSPFWSEPTISRSAGIRHPDNLGQNEKINKILNVKTGDTEYNSTVGQLGAFVVAEQMHGEIVHPLNINQTK